MFLRSIITISVIALSPCLLAATEFPNGLIPAEIADEFSSGKIYSSLPDNFPVPVLVVGLNCLCWGVPTMASPPQLADSNWTIKTAARRVALAGLLVVVVCIRRRRRLGCNENAGDSARQ